MQKSSCELREKKERGEKFAKHGERKNKMAALYKEERKVIYSVFIESHWQLTFAK